MKKLYIDEEEGISRKTCHPKFNSILRDDIYINIIEEFAPFGNDEGWEILRELEEWYLNNENESSIILDFLTNYSNENWGWSESDLSKIQTLEIETINNIQNEDDDILDIFPQIVIATVFGQFKIIGKINDQLKITVQKVIEQQKLIASQRIEGDEIDLSKLIKVVDGESTRVNEEGNMNNVLINYINRLTKMSKDIEQIPTIKLN